MNSFEIARTFARVTATEITQAVDEQNKDGLFLSVTTVPSRPEPEFGLLG